MRPRIQHIFTQLEEFGSETNEAFVDELCNISDMTEDDIERDQAIDLMLFCEGNENGSLGMDSLSAIALRFNKE